MTNSYLILENFIVHLPLYSTKKFKKTKVGFWATLTLTFSMLTGRTVWCGCYILAPTERNNNQVSFSFITLINARSSSMCEVFWWLPSVWGESYMNGVVQEKRQPHQPYQALWWVSQWDYSWSNLVLCGKRLANALFCHRRFLDDDHVRQV